MEDQSEASCSVPSFSPAEQVLITSLVGPCTEVQRFVLERLEEWFKALENRLTDACVFDSDPEARLIVELKHNFGRILKMFICTALIAKERETVAVLATSISDCLASLAPKPSLMSLFVERLFVVLVEEWSWMEALPESGTVFSDILLRAVVQKLFQVIAGSDWRDEYLDPLLTNLNLHVLNHHPPPPRSTRAGSKTPALLEAPAQLQIQFSRIFLQELPCSHPKTLKVLSLFLQEVVESKSADLVQELTKGVLSHVTKISDRLIKSNVESLGTSLKEIGLDDGSQQSTPPETICDSNGNVAKVSPNVVNYGEIVAQLRESTGKNGNKAIVQDLLDSFESLQVRCNSHIPSGGSDTVDDSSTPIITTAAVMISGRKRKVKVRQKLSLKAAAANSALGSSAQWSSFYLNDPELLDHICDNYMSYLVELERNPLLSSTSSSTLRNSKSLQSDSDEPRRKEPRLSEHLFKRRKLLFETDAGSDSAPNGAETNSHNAEAREAAAVKVEAFKDNINVSVVEMSPTVNGDIQIGDIYELIEDCTPTKRKLAKRSDSGDIVSESLKGEIVSKSLEATPKLLQSDLSDRCTPVTPTPFPKGVRFVLAKNLEHEHDDYENSIERNPDVPHDGNRTPTRGLLKSKSLKAPMHWKKKAAAAAAATATPKADASALNTESEQV